MEERRHAIGESIVIGYTPENEARRIVIDVRRQAALWPDAEVKLWVQRRGDAAPYVAQAAYADGEIAWTVTDYDTAMSGCGEAWAAFFGRDGDALLALAGPSVVTVLPGPHGFAAGTPEDQMPPWAVEVIEAARRIEGGGSAPGADGGYYVPSVDADGTLRWTASKAGMPEVQSANVKGGKGDKGDKGDTGAAGADGKDGYTPVKGTDYWTDADRQQMVSDVLAELPDDDAPEIDDTAVRPDAVWSSQKVAQMLGVYIDEVDALIGGES